MILKNKYIKYLLFFILFCSVVISVNIAVRRFQFEQLNNKVELVVSYKELERLALWGGLDTEDMLKKVQESHVFTSIAVEEDTLEDFIEAGKVSALKGSEVMNMYRVGHVNRYLLTHLYKQVKVKPDHFYLIIDQKGDYERIRDFLEAEFGKEKVRRIGRWNILEVVAERQDLMTLGLGISPQKLEILQKLELNPIVRLKNSPRLSREIIKQKFLSFTGFLNSTTVIFEGTSVLGYPYQLPYVEAKIRDNQLKIGLIEFSQQAGMSNLAQNLSDRVLRVHSISGAEMKNMSKQKAESRYLRAAKERGIKVLFLHPIFQGQLDEPIVDYNMHYFQGIYQKLTNLGFELTPIKSMPVKGYNAAQNWEVLCLSLGVLTTILFFINYYIPMNVVRMLIIYLVFGASFYGFYLLGIQAAWKSVMALIAAILFPSLAMISQFPSEKQVGALQNRWVPALFYMLKTLGISVVGAFLIVGLLSDIEYVFGIQRFSGVKISFMVPIFLIGLFFFLRPHRISSMIYVFKRIFYAPVRTVALLSIVVCLSIIVILIIRSGNAYQFPTFIIEEKFRAILEHWLYIRPRTKEFLIGYPFLMISFLLVDRAISRSWLWFFNILGSISLISVVNSFCHVHTPLIVSVHRIILGLLLGILMGLIYLFFYRLFGMLYRRIL